MWRWLYRRRSLMVAGFHLLLAALSFYLAFALRLESSTPWKLDYGEMFFRALPILLVIRMGCFFAFDLFQGMWRYVSVTDMMRIVFAVTLGTMLFFPLAFFWLAGERFSRSVFVLDWAFCILLVGAPRLGIRAFREAFVPMKQGGRKVLIVGAGDAGVMMLREMKAHPHLGYCPVGFVDDLVGTRGSKIHGVKVLGGTRDIRRIVEKEGVDEVILAMPQATGREIQQVVDELADVAVRIRRVPTEGDIVRLSQIRDVEVEDLLERPPVRLDEERIEQALKGRRVLVTGAGGSIGSELVRQIAEKEPASVCLLDWNENSLFFFERELLDHYPKLDFNIAICDMRDVDRVEGIFAEGKFHHVYHAAAFKHVPLMESNPMEAVKNNVGGTRVLAEAALRHGAEKFVLISSDKAVRPTSVMGATKRVAEQVLSAMPREKTQFLSVRFGNVLGSRGSVVPLFKKQIADGGPVTVTDPEVIRYFMTIPEAVQLVLQAGVMGQGGEVFLLDMGEPVKIVDLARKLIRLCGFQPEKDIEIRFVGLRPGEKLYEELLVEAEDVQRTEHQKIWVLNGHPPEPEDVRAGVDKLLGYAEAGRIEDAFRTVAALVPDYHPQNDRYRGIVEAARAGSKKRQAAAGS